MRLARRPAASYGVEEAGYEVGRLQLWLHAARMRMGRDWKAEFLRLARRLRPLLPPEAGRKLVALVEAVPPCDVLLHGDLHLSNMVVRDGELAPIDMEFVGFGDPVFDLAISRSRTFQIVPSLAGRTGVPEERASELARS